MNRDDQIQEIKTLLNLVANSATALDETEMEFDAGVFTDPGVYKRETEKLFRHGPLCVGPSCLLKQPGDYWTFDDTGVPILLVRTQSGQVKGYVNICSHRSAPVAVGRGNADLSLSWLELLPRWPAARHSVCEGRVPVCR
jgi:Rieske [2Fe-2S] domain